MAKVKTVSPVNAQSKGTASDVSVDIIDTPRKSSNPRYRRMRRTTYQARLGRKLDRIANLVLDNNIRLNGHPTDMIRIQAKRDDRTHDLISRTIQDAEVMPIILPPMKDIPLRHFLRGDTDVLIPSLYATYQQEDYFEVYAPVECNLELDDLLIRILYDSTPEVSEPYIMVLQVKDLLGTFANSSLMWKKCIVTFSDERLPQEVINILKADITKREKLNW